MRVVSAVPDGVHHVLQRVQAGEQKVDVRLREGLRPLARRIQTILHRMGQPHHLVEAHGPRHPLQRVGGTENLVDDVHIDHVLLQGQQEVVQLLKVVVRLIQESAKVLAHVHIRHDLPSPNS